MSNGIEELAARPDCIAGTDKAEELKASLHGSHIFGSGSKESKDSDYITCGKGPDTIYFSACHIKNEKDGLDTAVIDFNPEHDKLVFFCTHQTLSSYHIDMERTELGVVITLTSNRGGSSKIALFGVENTENIKVELNIPFKTVCSGSFLDTDHDGHHHGSNCHHHHE